LAGTPKHGHTHETLKDLNAVLVAVMQGIRPEKNSQKKLSAREKRGKLGKAGENGGKRRKLGELKERRNGAAVSFQFPTLYSALGNRNVASTREKHGKYF